MLISWSNLIVTGKSTYLLKEGVAKEVYEVKVSGEEEREFRRLVEEVVRRGIPCVDGWVQLNDFNISNEMAHILRKLGVLKDGSCEPVSKEDVFLAGATLEVTPFCPFRCKHCLLPIEWRQKRSWMPLETALRVINEIAGVVRFLGGAIALTGGEPSVLPRSYLKTLTDLVGSYGWEVMINTNGLNYKSLVNLGDHVYVKVSLYGCDETSYKMFTGIDAFKAVERTLRELRDSGSTFSIDLIYTRSHSEAGYTVEQMVEFARKYTKYVRVRSAYYPGWSGDMKPTSQSVPITQEQLVREEYFLRVNRLYRGLFGVSDPCATTFTLDAFVRHDGYVMTCPFFDGIVTHIENPKWIEMFYVKERSAVRLPWRGGICNIHRF